MITVGALFTGVCGGFAAPFVAFTAELVTPTFLSRAPSSRSFSLLEPPVSLDIIRWKRPVDFGDGAGWEGRGGAKSTGGPSSRKSIKSRALLEILGDLGVLKLESVRDSAFSSSEPFMILSRSMSVMSRRTFRMRLGLSESSRGLGPGMGRL